MVIMYEVFFFAWIENHKGVVGSEVHLDERLVMVYLHDFLYDSCENSKYKWRSKHFLQSSSRQIKLTKKSILLTTKIFWTFVFKLIFDHSKFHLKTCKLCDCDQPV